MFANFFEGISKIGWWVHCNAIPLIFSDGMDLPKGG